MDFIPKFHRCCDNYDVVGVYNVENAQKKAMEACDQMEPVVRAIFTNTEIDGKIVLAAEIPPVEYWRRPVFYKGAGRLKGSYIRVGDADEPMSEYEVYSFEAFRRRIRDELRTILQYVVFLYTLFYFYLIINSCCSGSGFQPGGSFFRG